MSTIAIIGGGNIGEALISGLLAADRDPQSIIATNRTRSRSEYLEKTYGIRTTDDNQAAADGADYIFLCVKPPQIVPLLGELSETIDQSGSSIVVSLASGVTTSAMEDALSAGSPVVRVMPNTPMLIGKGLSACAAGRFVTEDQMDAVSELLGAVGDVVVVGEDDMDVVSAVSGAGPAYYFLMTEALIEAGVQQGLKRDVATKLARSVAAGAGALLETSEDEPAKLRANISSPGGVTIAALRELEESGLRGAFFRAIEISAQRSAELGAPSTTSDEGH